MLVLDGKEYEIKGSTQCECGNQFTLQDVDEIKKINQRGFYGNTLNNYSEVTCNKCNKRAIIFLKQKGQSWEIIDSAKEVVKEEPKKEQDNAEETKTTIEPTNNNSNEFICPVCEKVCKSKIGLNAHLKTHEN